MAASKMFSERTAKKVSIAGAVLAALAASSCCIGPLLVAALGIGGAGAFATIGAYRPHMLVGTAALLGVGYYLTYRKPRVTGDACGCEKPNRTANRASKIGLWIATAMVVLFAAVPPIFARLARRHEPVAVAAGVAVETTTIRVQGIDCEGCATGLRRAMSSVGGFHDLKLDIPNQTVHVTYEPAPGRLEAYAKAIEDQTGYEVTLPANATMARPQ
jgi:mercuric ion transport protein